MGYPLGKSLCFLVQSHDFWLLILIFAVLCPREVLVGLKFKAPINYSRGIVVLYIYIDITHTRFICLAYSPHELQ